MSEIKSGWFIITKTILKSITHGVFSSKEDAEKYVDAEKWKPNYIIVLFNYVILNNKIHTLNPVDFEIQNKENTAEIKTGWFVELFSDGSHGHIDKFVGVFGNQEEAENYAYNVHEGFSVMDIFECEYIERGTEIQVLRYMDKNKIIKR